MAGSDNVPVEDERYTFNFTVDAFDAENIMSFMHDAYCKASLEKLHILADNKMNEEDKQKHIDWYDKHMKYIEGLKKTISEGITRIA